MPQELLRDVFRTGDRIDRTRRRMSILPISIAAHAVAGTLFVIMPLAAEVEVPPIAPAFRAEYMPTAAPPPPPARPRTASAVPEPRPGAPTIAPSEIAPELPRVDGPVVDGALDLGPSTGGPGALIANIAPAPPPPVVEPVQPRIARPGFQGVREPKKIVNVVPEYPEIARISRKEGQVILEAVLDVTGRVQSVRVLKSETLLDDAAIRAVKQWRYTPTELNGMPVQVLMTITVNFTLAR